MWRKMSAQLSHMLLKWHFRYSFVINLINVIDITGIIKMYKKTKGINLIDPLFSYLDKISAQSYHKIVHL